MRVVMELALQDAGISPDVVGYVNGHGTATEHGDIAETRATSALFGKRMPLSSQKSYLGHTLGACGALEAWFSIEMMNAGWFAPTLNLDNIDPRCGELEYITGEGRANRHRLRDEQQLRVRRREHFDGVQALEVSPSVTASGTDTLPLFLSSDAQRPVAWRRGAPVPLAEFRAHVAAVVARLPKRQSMPERGAGGDDQSLRGPLQIPRCLRRGFERRPHGVVAVVARRSGRGRRGEPPTRAVIASTTKRSMPPWRSLRPSRSTSASRPT